MLPSESQSLENIWRYLIRIPIEVIKTAATTAFLTVDNFVKKLINLNIRFKKINYRVGLYIFSQATIRQDIITAKLGKKINNWDLLAFF